MKKVILTLSIVALLLTAFPVSALQYPLTEGYDGVTENTQDAGRASCIVRRAGQGLPLSQFPVSKGISWCDSRYEPIKRTYALEQAVIELQTTVIQLQNLSDRITQLEQENANIRNRVGTLERMFNELRGLLVQVVQMLIGLINR